MIEEVNREYVTNLSSTTHEKNLKEEPSKGLAGRKKIFNELWSKEVNSEGKNLKEEFLEHLEEETMLKESTLKSYRIFIYKASDFEINVVQKQKDLYEFTDPEIETMIRYFQLSRYKSVASCISAINQYLKYAKEKGVIRNRLNITYNPTQEEMNSLLINRIRQKKQFVNRDELYNEICVPLVNWQDRLSYICPFEGLTYDDMINLKKIDVDASNNTLRLKDRILKVSQQCINFIQSAMQETVYLRSNGNTKSDDWAEIELVPTNYVFKPTEKILEVGANLPNDLDEVKVNSQLIYNRLYNTRNLDKIKRPRLNISTLRESGMIECLNDNKDKLLATEMELSDFQDILKNRFGKLSDTQLDKIKTEYLATTDNIK